jgi:hypothetical protein
MYLGVILDRRMAWRHHTERTVTETMRTYVRTFSIIKSGRSRTNIELTLYIALISSVKTYACPTWGYAADAHLLNCSVCRIEFSAVLEIFTSAQQPANCKWLSKFIAYMTMYN